MRGFSVFFSALLSLTVSSTISMPSQAAICDNGGNSSSSSRSSSDCDLDYDSLSDGEELPKNESNNDEECNALDDLLKSRIF